MSESLDDLAAFLMHRSADEGLSTAERLEIYAVVAAYQEGYDPPGVEIVLRNAGRRFASHPNYDDRWQAADPPA